MCLISVAKKGTQKNTKEVYDFIRSGAEYNTDGSGFMYKRPNEGVVHIDKGYFNIQAMIDKLASLNLTEDDELVIHHRTGTSGKISPENTHPFVISDIPLEVEAVNLSIDKPAMVHNGMFSYIHELMWRNKDFSDTYAFARYVLGNKNLLNLYKEDPEYFQFIFKGCIGTDKICILFPEADRDLEMIGRFIEHNGYFHSNSGYCVATYDKGGYNWRKHQGTRIGFPENSSEEEKREKVKEVKTTALNSRFGDTLPKYSTEQDGSIILLDNSYIKLTPENVSHFKFVQKKVYNNTLPQHKKGLLLKNLSDNSFDPDAGHHILEFKLNSINKTISEGIKTKELVNEFYYIPNGEKYKNIYGDYKELVDVKTVPNISNINFLKGVLAANTSGSKKDEDLIWYRPYGESYCKKALQLLLERYEKLYAEYNTPIDSNDVKLNGYNGPFKSIVSLFDQKN